MYKTGKWLAILLCVALLLTACSADEPEATAQPEATAEAGGGVIDIGPGEGTAPILKGSGLAVDETVAFAFENMLYGGVVYTNTEDYAMTLKEATFTFTYPGGTRTETAAPFAGDADVLLPGESGNYTIFLDQEGLEEGAAVSVTVAVQGETTESRAIPLQVSDAMLLENYPFPTLSGKLTNVGEETSSINTVYVRFYDGDGVLLGIWYFPYNAVLQSGQSTAFVVHMRSFALPGLTENTARMEFHAYGAQ